MKKMLIAFAVLMLALPTFLPVASAQDAATIKQNMINRLPAIAAMKSKGLAGEDNRGYLAAVSSQLSAADQAVIDAENADRKLVFEKIAQKESIPVEAVARRMAGRMSEHTPAGTWIQDGQGNWSVKQ